jgi:hypothetical protein
VAVPFEKVPLAPDAGAVNVTFSPLIGIPLKVTFTASGPLKLLPLAALCDEPLVALSPTARVAGVGAVAGIELPLLPQPVRKLRSKPTNDKLTA